MLDLDWSVSRLVHCHSQGLFHVGSFGLCDPASKEMHEYLERLEEQQKKVLDLITGKKQELVAKYSGKSALKVRSFTSPVLSEIYH